MLLLQSAKFLGVGLAGVGVGIGTLKFNYCNKKKWYQQI